MAVTRVHLYGLGVTRQVDRALPNFRSIIRQESRVDPLESIASSWSGPIGTPPCCNAPKTKRAAFA